MALLRTQIGRLIGLGLAAMLLGGAFPSGASFQAGISRDGESSFQLNWESPAEGYRYIVQWRDALEAGEWQNLPDEAFEGTTATEWIDARPAAETARFYRVMAVPIPAERGKLISSTLIRSLSAFQINFLAAQQGIPFSAQYGVRVYKVVYETIDPRGLRTQASGAVMLPQNPAAPVPLMSYQHGTILRKADVPSNESGEASLGVLLAASGYATAMPDYLGLGESPGFHPYHHARSQATASVDMLRAARTVSAANAIGLNGQLFLTGYSQGGHATMALHRELEAEHPDEFSVAASAPMAGAYDLSGVTLDDFLSQREMPNPYYFVYLLEAYRQVYGLADSLDELLAAPYDSTLPPLLDGFHSSSEVNAAMPARPLEILKPDYLNAFLSDPNHPLQQALRENDVHDWTPMAPLRLYHCSGDEDVIFANSEKARDTFHARGATHVTLFNPDPAADHGDCAQPSLLSAKEWFDSLKQ